MNSKYNNYKRLEEGRKLADVNVDVEDNKATSTQIETRKL